MARASVGCVYYAPTKLGGTNGNDPKIHSPWPRLTERLPPKDFRHEKILKQDLYSSSFLSYNKFIFMISTEQ